MNKSVFLQTFGCQMNERDSEEVLGMLAAQGYELTQQPERADVILLNTCSVREHAEERAFGKMGELSVLKHEKPNVILGIIGCMAKLQQDVIFKRLPFVDLIAGPAELYDLPYLLAEVQEKRQAKAVTPADLPPTVSLRETKPWGANLTAGALQQSPTHSAGKVIAVNRVVRPLERKPAGDYRRPGVSAFVTIMEGCDKRCTYCIVPMTRGQEISRPAEEILDEITALVEAGYKEVTLLGQNVNSYGKRFPDGSGYKGPLGRLRFLEEDPDALLDFPQLLRMIDASVSQRVLPPGSAWLRQHPSERRLARPCEAGLRSADFLAVERAAEVRACCENPTRSSGSASPASPPGCVRIRFTTSHPFDATARLFEAMRDCPSVCEWLHLPVQSGSNRILRAMRRGYTHEAYLEKIDCVRRLIPDISLSTDIIVGFPGETEEDFEQTVSLMREVEYDNAYIFKYSPRPGTDAAAWVDDVPREVKEERNQILLALQDEMSLTRYRRFEGQTIGVLIEGPGKHAGQLFGRTRGNHGVILDGPASWVGMTLPARVTRATAHTLFGERCHDSSR